LSVIGREFPMSLIRALFPKSEDELNHLLSDLQLAEFIYEQPAVGDTQYIFKHALTQEVSHNSVCLSDAGSYTNRSAARLKRYSRKISRTICTSWRITTRAAPTGPSPLSFCIARASRRSGVPAIPKPNGPSPRRWRWS